MYLNGNNNNNNRPTPCILSTTDMSDINMTLSFDDGGASLFNRTLSKMKATI